MQNAWITEICTYGYTQHSVLNTRTSWGVGRCPNVVRPAHPQQPYIAGVILRGNSDHGSIPLKFTIVTRSYCAVEVVLYLAILPI